METMMMRLLSTEIGEKHIELTYADNADLDEAATLLIWRLPTQPNQGKSVALNRFVALKKLQDFIRSQMDADENTSIMSS